MNNKLYLSCFFILSCLLANHSLQATTFSVTTLADAGAGSFRQALMDANTNTGKDVINFDVSGAINLSTILPAISDSVTINGHANGSAIRRIGGAPFRILDISNGANVTLNRLTIFGGSIFSGDGAGVLIQTNSVVTINDCCIRNNFANTTSRGGGLYVQANASLFIINCTVSDNSMGPGGGGGLVCAAGSDVTLMNCTFSHNTGGAILNYSFNFRMTNTILANSVPSNTADFTNTGGTVITNDNNIVELCASGTSCSFFSNADPGLGNLQINDMGATETRAIDTTSNAYNAGIVTGAPTEDQNGTTRDANPDIGAYEAQVIDGIITIPNAKKVTCSNKDQGPFEWQVLDLTGRLIESKKITSYQEVEDDLLKVQTNTMNYNLNQGLYILRVSTENKACFVKLFR